MHATVTAKGQITIPAEVRRKLGIKKGTRIRIEVSEDAKRIILTPITRAFIHSLRGRFKGAKLLRTLMIEKKKESAQ